MDCVFKRHPTEDAGEVEARGEPVQDEAWTMAGSETVWHRPRDVHELAPNEVQVWRATLDAPPEDIAGFMRVLSAEERAHAQRFHFEPDSRRHIIGRGLARTLLGHCLVCPADQVEFEYNRFGKPRLAASLGSSIEFNISHSGELVLVALTPGRAVGIDVERMQSRMATKEIATRFFSPNECRTLFSLAPELQCSAFFSCWTRKEAYLKARGDGLSLPLDTFDVAFAPGEEPRLLETRRDSGDAHRFTMRAPDPGHGCKAALVVEGSGWKLTCWDWRPEQPTCSTASAR
jgi:4'-phosphopantetheinyl transferase